MVMTRYKSASSSLVLIKIAPPPPPPPPPPARRPPLLLLRLVQAYHALEVALDGVLLLVMMMMVGRVWKEERIAGLWSRGCGHLRRLRHNAWLEPVRV